MKKYYVYVLRSLVDENLYIGVTTSLDIRISQHNQGQDFSTKQRRPFKLIYYEVFFEKKDAYLREKYLKTGWGRKHLRNALKYTLRQ